MRWGIQVWKFDLTVETIVNCFNKVLKIQNDSSQLFDQLPNQLSDGFYADFTMLRFWLFDLMSIENFLNPVDEVIQDGIETIDSIVLVQFFDKADDDDDTAASEVVQILKV